MNIRKKATALTLAFLMAFPLSGCSSAKTTKDYMKTFDSYSDQQEIYHFAGPLDSYFTSRDDSGYWHIDLDLSQYFYCSSDGSSIGKTGFEFILKNANKYQTLSDVRIVPSNFTDVVDTGKDDQSTWQGYSENPYKDAMAFTFDDTTASIRIGLEYVSYDFVVIANYSGDLYSVDEGTQIVSDSVQLWKDSLNPFDRFFEVTLPDWWNGLGNGFLSWINGMKGDFNSAVNGSLSTGKSASSASVSVSTATSAQGRSKEINDE